MPQLDRLAFSSQIFWLLLVFFFSYYFFLQLCILRIKFNLGLKRFLFQSEKYNSFYDLSKYYFDVKKNDNRLSLLFFFDNYNFTLESNQSKPEVKGLNFTFFDVSENDFLKNLFAVKILGTFLISLISVLDRLLSLVFSLFKSEKEDGYSFFLYFDKSYEMFLYNSLNKELHIELKDLNSLRKNINYFYDKFFFYFNYFFKLIRFYVYEVIFTLFFYFFNIFFKLRSIFYFFKLLKKSLI